MTMKKIISILLAAVMLFGITAVAAPADFRLELESYENQSGLQIFELPDRTVASMQTGSFAEYTVEIPEDGIYTIGLCGSSYVNFFSKFTLSADGKSYFWALAPTASWDDYQTAEFPGIPLKKGSTALRLDLDEGSYSLDYFRFVKTAEYSAYYLRQEFEDYIPGGEGVGYHDLVPGVDNANYIDRGDDVDVAYGGCGIVVGANVGEWWKYEIDVPADGYYEFSVSYAGPEGSSIQFSTESGQLVETELPKTASWAAIETVKTNKIFLHAGKQLIKAEVTKLGVNLDYFTLTADSESVFVFSGLKHAKSAEEIYRILSQTHDAIGLSWKLCDSLLAPSAGMYQLLERNFSSYEEIVETFSEVMQKEIENPHVQLSDQNGQNVTALQPGTYTLSVRQDLFFDPVTVIAAVYDGTRLQSAVYQENCTGNITKNLTVSEGNNLQFRIYFWRDQSPASDYRIAKNIYVSASGDDAANGSADMPVKTIERAKILAREAGSQDVTVHILGEYKITEPIEFSPEDSGVDGYTITYRGEHNAVLCGGEKTENWTKQDEHIWKTTLEAEDVRQFYVNGEQKTRARSGKMTGTGYWDNSYTKWERDGIKVSSGKLPAEITSEKHMELVWDLEWTRQRVPAIGASLSENELILKLKQPYFGYSYTKEFDGTRPAYNRSFWVENALWLLDEPGEFYFDRDTKTLYYYPKAGENLNTGYVGVSEGIFRIVGDDTNNRVRNLRFENLKFQYGTWLEPNEKGAVFVQADKIIDSEAETPLTGGHLTHAQVQLTNAENIEISGCDFTNLGSAAIGMDEGVRNCTVRKNSFSKLGAGAVMIGHWEHTFSEDNPKLCRNITVSDNEITKVGTEYAGSPGIGMYYARDIVIDHNTISDMPYSAISIGWGWGLYVGGQCRNIEVSYNHISDVVNVLRDGAGVYTLGDMPDTVIHDNYIRKTSCDQTWSGLYTDQGSAGLIFENNVVAECGYWFFSVSTANRHNTIRNNFSDTQNAKTNGSYITFENNTVCKNGWTDAAKAIISRAGVRQ